MKRVHSGFVMVVLVLVPGVSTAQQMLDFEGIPFDPTSCTGPVGNFYNGGGGTNLGIAFSSDARVLSLRNPSLQCTNSNVSRGGIGDPASQGEGLFFLMGDFHSFINVNAGFTTGFSFFYTAIHLGAGVDVWSGLNGTGTNLAHGVLGTTPSNAGGTLNCFGVGFCPFYPAGVTFAGTARSVTFSGAGSQIAFDDLTFVGSPPGQVAPEPVTFAMLAPTVFGLGVFARRRRPAV